MSALELSNCYFTPHKDMAEGGELVLLTDIDPYGYLAKAAGTALCYTEENAVLYFERQGSNDDDFTHIPFDTGTHQLNQLYLGSAT